MCRVEAERTKLGLSDANCVHIFRDRITGELDKELTKLKRQCTVDRRSFTWTKIVALAREFRLEDSARDAKGATTVSPALPMVKAAAHTSHQFSYGDVN